MKNTTKLALLTSGISLSYFAYKKISEEMFDHVFKRSDKQEEVKQKYIDWLKESNTSRVRVNSFDGLKLNAYYVKNHENHRYIILVHGIWSSKVFNYPRAYEFDKLGYNVLIIDQRSAGDSEGEYYTYGQKESLDLLLWINFIIKNDPEANICLYGVSMGAATVMLSSANKLPDNVKCIVEDCGYSSVQEEFDHYIRKYFKLQYTKPVLFLLERIMIEKLGMHYYDASPKDALKSNEIPLLIIHGDKDDFVPFEMSKKIYNSNLGIKKYYRVPGVEHTEAILDKNYFVNIDDFIKKYI